MTEKNQFDDKLEISTVDDLLNDPFGGEVLSLKPEELNAQKPVRLIDVIPEENRQKAFQLAKQIDPKNHQAMLSYGASAQEKLTQFSHTMLEHVQKKDLGEVGNIISALMKKLNEINPEELKPEKQFFFCPHIRKIFRFHPGNFVKVSKNERPD